MHNTHAILVVNLHKVDGIFKQKDLLKNRKHGDSRKKKVGFLITIGEDKKNENNENVNLENEKENEGEEEEMEEDETMDIGDDENIKKKERGD